MRVRRSRRAFFALLSSLLVIGSVPAVAGAAIGAVSGNVHTIAPPPSALPNALEHATDVLGWDEQQGVTLASGLRTDIRTPGLYDQAADLHTAILPAGTVVDSHIFHSDRPGPAGSATGTVLRQVTVTFPNAILGIIATEAKLTESDVVGAPGTVYGGANRSIGFGVDAGRDELELLSDQRTIVATLRTTSGLDQFRVLTRHNGPPTVSAGGPYSGSEGQPVPLAGVVSDPDGDTLTSAWSVTWTGAPGTVCAVTGESSLTPTVACTDDALVSARLTVNDGVNPAVSSTAAVSVGNAPPVTGTLVVPTAPVPLGTSAAISVPFSDAGTHDAHSATVAWGDTTSAAGSVSESGGSGSVTASRTYGAAGVYTVSVSVTDDDGATATAVAQIAVNGAPAADAGGPYSGAEGLPTALVGTAVDPEGDPLTYGWTLSPGALDAGGSCTSSAETTLTPSVTCTDDAVVGVDLSASDGINPPVVSSTTVAVANEAPLLGAVAVTSGPVPVGGTVNVAAPFTDDGTNDTHTATVAWGDLTSDSGAVTESGGAGSLSAGHVYTAPGIYTVRVSLSDDDLGTDERTATVVVNSPPTVDAGGPYAGVEGAPMSLAGAASDADGDPLGVVWSFAVDAAPGTVCLPIGLGTLTPTLTCNDDAVVTATLTVDDGVNPPVVDIATLAVGNAAPLLSTAVPSDATVPVGTAVSVGLAFSDDGANDTHTATIDWGDGVVEPGTVNGSSGTVSGSHSYAHSGTYEITVTVVDDDGAATEATTAVTANGAPTAGVGGPYQGVEGAPVVLTGTAADPDADALSVTWTATILSADAGTHCALSGDTTLTPALTCDDDAQVRVTITVADGVHPPVVDSTTVSLVNGDPSAATPVVTPNPVPLGSPVSLLTSFTDPGVNDNHSATITWGDATSSVGLVSEVPGSGTVTGGHTFAAAGTYQVKVSVSDKDGGVNSATVPVLVDAPPTVDAAGPYVGSEGVPRPLNGTAVDPDGEPLALSWSFSVSTDPGGACTMSGTATLVPSVTCSDDSTVVATLTADDGVNAPVTDTATITIANRDPGIGIVTVPSAPVPVGTSVSALTTFVDPGTNDHHTATIAWGDGAQTAGTVVESAGNGSVAGTHAFTSPGTYAVSVTVWDDDGGSVVGTASARVVVFDGGTGFVTGGGWINSPGNAYTPDNPSDAALAGKAEFGFVVRKRPSDPAPTGSTEFQVRLRRTGTNRGCDDRRDDGWSRETSLEFKSVSYSSLTVTGASKAVFRGTGRVDGASGYEFLVSVIDGRSTHTADRFRIKIWKTSTGQVLYDSQAGAADGADAAAAVSGGSIVIHG